MTRHTAILPVILLASAAIGIAGSVVSAVGYLSWLFNLATIVPSIAVAVRSEIFASTARRCSVRIVEVEP